MAKNAKEMIGEEMAFVTQDMDTDSEGMDAEPATEVTDIVAPQNNALGIPVDSMTFEQKVELAKAATNFQSIWNVVKEGGELEIDVKEILTYETEVTDRSTGEIVGKHRTTFICTDGSAWSTTSDAVFSSMCIVSGIFGPSSTWGQPLHLKFVRETAQGGNPFVNVIF